MRLQSVPQDLAAATVSRDAALNDAFLCKESMVLLQQELDGTTVSLRAALDRASSAEERASSAQSNLAEMERRINSERIAREQELRDDLQNTNIRLESLRNKKSQLQYECQELNRGGSQGKLDNLRSQLNAAQAQAAEKKRLLQDELASTINIRDSNARQLDSA